MSCLRKGEKGWCILDRTVFYPEGGGQVGDAGVIEARDGSFRFRVDDTQRVGPVVVHVGTAEKMRKATAWRGLRQKMTLASPAWEISCGNPGSMNCPNS